MSSPVERPQPAGSIPIPAYPSVTAKPTVRSTPPTKDSFAAAQMKGELGRLDGALVGAVLVLAFILASFVALNSDVWIHLATGRLIAQGNYEFGSDPFSYTTAGVRWVNHAWLADLVAYLTSSSFGGPDDPSGGAVLVILKALVIVAVAGVMLFVGRGAGGMWVPVIGVTIALLAMIPRLLLQPRCLSFLFLGITLLLLTRPSGTGKNWSRLLGIPIFFFVWVNVDEWFVLGPLTVMLFLIAAGVEQSLTPQSSRSVQLQADTKSLSLALILGLLACLLNPYHVFAFQLPAELYALFHTEANDPQISALLQSPFRWEYMNRPGVGLIPAGVAYGALLGLGFASFYVVRDRWPWWRGCVWTAFALLSLRFERAIPFFAVTGTIVTILNWQDFLAGNRVANPSTLRQLLVGRLVSIAAIVALIALAWPGWLHPDKINPALGHRPRRVGWGIHVDPSLRGAALKVSELRARNVIPAAQNGFSFSRDFAHYCAWFCPEEKSFVDYRSSLFADTLPHYADLRDALLKRSAGGDEQSDWRETFRERNIRHVIVGGNDLELLRQAQSFWRYPDRWAMLYGDGRTGIFGWCTPQDVTAAEAFRRNELDLTRLAYGPDIPPEYRAPENAPPAAGPTSWWAEVLEKVAPHPLAADAANMYSAYYEVRRRAELDSQNAYATLVKFKKMLSWCEALAVAPAGGGLAQALYATRYDMGIPGQQIHFALIRGPAPNPSGALILAVRAARVANAQNPNDPGAHAALGSAYLSLWQQQEAPWLNGGRGTLLHQLRLVQIVTAMQKALAFMPDDHLLHQALARAFEQMDVNDLVVRVPQAQISGSFLDLTLHHKKEFLRLTRERGPGAIPGISVEDFPIWLDGEERNIAEQEKSENVEARRKHWQEAPANSRLERAALAVQLGLIQQALHVLDDSQNPAPLEPREGPLYLRLKLVTGRAGDIQNSEHRFEDSWDNVLFAAAIGDYHKADVYLEEWTRKLDEARLAALLTFMRQQFFPSTSTPVTHTTLFTLDSALAKLQERIDLEVIRGVLALEVGDTPHAAKCFRDCLDLSASPTYLARRLLPLTARTPLDNLALAATAHYAAGLSAVPFSLRPVATRYLQLLQDAR